MGPKKLCPRGHCAVTRKRVSSVRCQSVSMTSATAARWTNSLGTVVVSEGNRNAGERAAVAVLTGVDSTRMVLAVIFPPK